MKLVTRGAWRLKFGTYVISGETYLCLLVYAHVFVSGERKTNEKRLINLLELSSSFQLSVVKTKPFESQSQKTRAIHLYSEPIKTNLKVINVHVAAAKHRKTSANNWFE